MTRNASGHTRHWSREDMNTRSRDLRLISSMGGTASTSLIGWCAGRTATNCPQNSEGLPAPGPGANPRGLKHRISPPRADDPYLPSGAAIKGAVFLFDSPYRVVPSLFRRRIAEGHAIAITGNDPGHHNDLDAFAKAGTDSFGFHDQFHNWTTVSAPYPRLIVRFDALWDFVPELLEFLEIDAVHARTFILDSRGLRRSSFEGMSPTQREALKAVYAELHARMLEYPDLNLIPATP